MTLPAMTARADRNGDVRPQSVPKARPRIALVAASLDILGGQGVQAADLAEALAGEGLAVSFIPINPRFPPGLRWVRRVPCVRTMLNEALYLPALAGFRRVDVAHLFSASYWSFLLAPAPAIVAAKMLGKRIVLHYHSGEAEDHLARFGMLVHPWLRLVDEIVVPSRYLARIFERHGYRPRVIRNVVDTSRFRYRDRIPLRPRLLSTRNLEAHYCVENTLQAFAILQRRYPAATLTVAGYGSREAALRRLAGALGARDVHFAGRVEQADVPALYHGADIFLNSSVIDNQPVSILEALASGLPVVSTATGDIPAMLRDGEAGRLVPPGDPAAMADAVAGLLEHPERALRVARNGRDAVREYSWPSVRDAWREVYRGVAA